VDQRVDVDEARVGKFTADRLHRRNVSLAHRKGEAAPALAIAAEGGRPRPFAGHVTEEGDLVHRREQQGPMVRMRCDMPRRGERITREMLGELGVERVAMVGIAVMAQIPDRQDLVMPLGGKERFEISEVVSAVSLVDQRPRDSLAGNRNTERGEQPIIFLGMDAVLRFLAQVAAADVLPFEGRAFETAQKESWEDAKRVRHGALNASPVRLEPRALPVSPDTCR